MSIAEMNRRAERAALVVGSLPFAQNQAMATIVAQQKAQSLATNAAGHVNVNVDIGQVLGMAAQIAVAQADAAMAVMDRQPLPPAPSTLSPGRN